MLTQMNKPVVYSHRIEKNEYEIQYNSIKTNRKIVYNIIMNYEEGKKKVSRYTPSRHTTSFFAINT